ncbi:MAG: IS91 family transposase [Planctomycetota bacterium]|nr:IS91 family transposase [Planctomycetota bacterium]
MRSPASLQSILNTHYTRYAKSRRLRADVQRAAHRIRDCQTAALGGHVERCECGHVSRIRYNSCRHRSCPQCRGGRRAQWLEQLSSQLLPCDHVHVIFTVPDGLNSIWQFNRILFSDLLMQAARESLDELLRDAKYLGACPGIISALHTWGRNLSVHPHVHCLVTAGGIDGDGRFVPLPGQTLLPARVLMAVFRGKLRHLLLQAIDEGRLRIPTGTSVARVQSLLNRLGRIPWNVRIQERYSHGISVAGYLARYMTGGPISNRRICSVTDAAVVFWYRDHRDGVKKRMSLTPDDFLSRWFEHVPPRGLRMLRRSGLYANSCSKKREAIQRQLRASPNGTRETVFALEPERCPVCNTKVICRDVVIISIPRPHPREVLVRLNQPP